ncbi:MAG TPA: hypothetical protein VJJ20_01955 [Candidatus Paceibacterota bacterium]
MQIGPIFFFAVAGVLPNVLLGWYIGRNVTTESMGRACGFIALWFFVGLVWAALMAYLAFSATNRVELVGGLVLACLFAAIGQIVGCVLHFFDKKDREEGLLHGGD